MNISDRIYYIIADGTPNQAKLEALIGKPSSSLKPSMLPADEYVAGIDLDEPATPFNQRLAMYGDVPMSTFSILA